MRVRVILASSLCVVMGVSILSAKQPNAALQALDDALPGTLINDPSKMDLEVYGPGATNKVIKDKAIPGGGAALQIGIPAVTKNAYDIGGRSIIPTPVKSGQKIVAVFYARTIKADTPNGKGKIGARIQQSDAPYSGFADQTFEVGSEWELFEVKGVSNITTAAKAANLGFMLGGAKQTVQIGQVIIVEGADSLKTVTKTTAAPGASGGKPSAFAPNFEGKGTLISNPSAHDGWSFYGPGLTRKAIADKAMPEGTASSINMASTTPNVYDAGINIPINAAVAQGDVLTVAFAARAMSAETETGAGKIGIRVQQNKAPYSGFGDNTIAIGPNWKLYQLRTQAKVDLPNGGGVVALHMGGARQLIQLGPVYVLNAGPPAPKP
jgi:hypothetical protein